MRVVRTEAVSEVTLLLPIDAGDLLGVLHAALRLRVADLTIDLLARAAWQGTRRLPLTPREFALLAALAQVPGGRVTRAGLLAEIWGTHRAPPSNMVEVHLSRLRAKLGDARAGVRIETLREGGWRLVMG